MSNRKNYNSIVFLTTLSVYLGLVLAGGAAVPHALAQAALTRDFDIRNEIEFKDDLDKKPDNEEIDSFFEIGLDQAVATFIEDLRRFKQEGKYKFDSGEILSIKCGHSFCSDDGGSASISIRNDENELFGALQKLHERLDIAGRKDSSKILFVGVSEETNKGCKDIGLSLSFSNKELEIAVRFSRESTPKAFAFTEHLNRHFADKSSISSDLLVKQLYANTKARFENNQVFVVTRLPRASIDEFFSK